MVYLKSGLLLCNSKFRPKIYSLSLKVARFSGLQQIRYSVLVQYKHTAKNQCSMRIKRSTSRPFIWDGTTGGKQTGRVRLTRACPVWRPTHIRSLLKRVKYLHMHCGSNWPDLHWTAAHASQHELTVMTRIDPKLMWVSPNWPVLSHITRKLALINPVSPTICNPTSKSVAQAQLQFKSYEVHYLVFHL